MIRKIIKIDEEKCNGCGLCADACHEGAIGMVDGKARLLREDYCDGLGDCLPACPTGAISFEEREAPAYDHAAVLAAKAKAGNAAQQGGCPGNRSRTFGQTPAPGPSAKSAPSALTHWPVQLRLVPVRAPYFDGADILVAADCAAYAHGGFHPDFLHGRRVVIGCPKLDPDDQAEKLAEIFRQNDIKSVAVVRMEVPCCGGIERAAKTALAACGKDIPLSVATIGVDGRILESEELT